MLNKLDDYGRKTYMRIIERYLTFLKNIFDFLIFYITKIYLDNYKFF